MRCPTCSEEGTTSRVYSGGSSVTLMADLSFWDEDGKHHNHDPNTRTNSFHCSQGHRWAEAKQGSCWCGWPTSGPEVEREETG